MTGSGSSTKQTGHVTEGYSRDFSHALEGFNLMFLQTVTLSPSTCRIPGIGRLTYQKKLLQKTKFLRREHFHQASTRELCFMAPILTIISTCWAAQHHIGIPASMVFSNLTQLSIRCGLIILVANRGASTTLRSEAPIDPTVALPRKRGINPSHSTLTDSLIQEASRRRPISAMTRRYISKG